MTKFNVSSFLPILATLFMSTTDAFTANTIMTNSRTSSRTSLQMTSHDSSVVSRRVALMKSSSALIGAAGLSTTMFPFISNAEVADETPRVTTRMGGLLEKYQDSRGWIINAPSGWNKFEGEPGAYDVNGKMLLTQKKTLRFPVIQ